MANAVKVHDGVDAMPEPPVIKLTEGKLTEKTVSEIHGHLQEIVNRANEGWGTGNWLPNHHTGNVNGQAIHATFGTAATPIEIYHGLGRVPQVYPIMRRNKAGDVYDANAGEWSDTKIWLQSSVDALEVILWLM